MRLLDKINKAARDWERTKDPKYKKEWYRLCRVFANVGLNKKSNAKKI
mgnify:FL=1